MNDDKLNALLKAARNEFGPEPDAQFEARVMRSISRIRPGGNFSVLDQLAALFPRIAIGATALICLCLIGDVCLAAFLQPDFSTSIAELSQQWFFAAN